MVQARWCLSPAGLLHLMKRGARGNSQVFPNNGWILQRLSRDSGTSTPSLCWELPCNQPSSNLLLQLCPALCAGSNDGAELAKGITGLCSLPPLCLPGLSEAAFDLPYKFLTLALAPEELEMMNSLGHVMPNVINTYYIINFYINFNI